MGLWGLLESAIMDSQSELLKFLDVGFVPDGLVLCEEAKLLSR